MPFHFHNVEFEKIELSIPKQNVNIFLSRLWDDFEETIGHVSCQHSYLETNDPEIYEYNICWSDKRLPFIAELSFFNHTAKGMIYILLETLDYETKIHDPKFHEEIKNSIRRCMATVSQSINLEPTCFLKVTLESQFELSGNYRLEKSNIILLVDEVDNRKQCHIIFPIFNTVQAEIQFEGVNKSINIASVLTISTQNLFSINEIVKFELIRKSVFDELILNTDFNGKYVPDDGLITRLEFYADDGARLIIDDQIITKDIIEERDCIVNDKLCLPERFELFLKVVEDDYRLQQSCRRFHEAILFRSMASRTPRTIFYTAYELVAYVAAIEAVLDTQVEQVEVTCPSCGSVVFKEEWKISEKFRNFIAENSDNNPIFNKVFKELYNDRSMFVHTGVNLHSLTSVRKNRPFILKGKRYLSELPSYYYNIHEYTE